MKNYSRRTLLLSTLNLSDFLTSLVGYAKRLWCKKNPQKNRKKNPPPKPPKTKTLWWGIWFSVNIPNVKTILFIFSMLIISENLALSLTFFLLGLYIFHSFFFLSDRNFVIYISFTDLSRDMWTFYVDWICSFIFAFAQCMFKTTSAQNYFQSRLAPTTNCCVEKSPDEKALLIKQSPICIKESFFIPKLSTAFSAEGWLIEEVTFHWLKWNKNMSLDY